ncbi:MAG: hypothetical protein V1896_03050 [Candidatus Zambryskibacteria bacterium]
MSAADIIGIPSEPIIDNINTGLGSKNEEEFVDSSFILIKDLIDEKIKHPEIFQKAHRENVIQRSGNIKLSELMYYNVDLENGTAMIHVGHGEDLSLGEILKAFREGLKELAKQVQDDERIKEIQATSWIAAKNPGLLGKAGFTYEGLISEKEKIEHFKDETRPVGWAHIDRDLFLEKYLEK